ncbi:hypothetical protein BLA29_002650 [Euroglyphus maynei]|uniref:Uncharacterized protein n=1 Tax=Euroglyphus maynei TaxID=6958 RepID=A0A1Y3AN60_EURMA|nr:hypothetical protein BLA29_002650 [Euroglyphus maynei]
MAPLMMVRAQKGDPSFMPKIMPITSTINRTGIQRVYCTANSQSISQTTTFAVVNNRLYQFQYDMSVIIFEDLDAHYNDDQQRFFLDIGTRYELMAEWEKMLKTNLDYYSRYNFILKNIPDERNWRITMAMITHPSYGAGFYSYLGFSRYFYLLLVNWDKKPPATSSDVAQTQHIILSNYSIIVSISAETEYFALVLMIDNHGEDHIFVYQQQINDKSVPRGTFCESETGEQYFHQRKPKDHCKTGAQLSQMLREFEYGFTAKKNLYLVATDEQYVIVVDTGILKSYDMEYPYQRFSLDDVFVCKAARSPAIYPTLYPKGSRPDIEAAVDSFGGMISGGDQTWLFSPTIWLIIKKYRIPTFGRSKFSKLSSARSSGWRSKLGSRPPSSSRVTSALPSSAISTRMQSPKKQSPMKKIRSPPKKRTPKTKKIKWKRSPSPKKVGRKKIKVKKVKI